MATSTDAAAQAVLPLVHPKLTSGHRTQAAVTASDVTASLRVTVSCDDVTPETGLSAAQPLRRHTGVAAQPLRRHRGVTASLFGA